MRIRSDFHYFFGCLLALISFGSLLAFAQQARTSAPLDSGANKWKHPKSMDNLDAIGTRNISGSRVGNWYSLEKETKLGQDCAHQVEGFTKPFRDPFITEYVNRVGQNLVRNSDAKFPFVIKVIDSEEVNAFALPGGFLYVTSGLLLSSEDEAELAGVMAHEIAHVAARHATRQMTRSQMFDLASVPLIAFGGGIVLAARAVIGPIATMKFSRNYEAEADYLAVEYAYKAGYDPTALITILERLSVDETQSTGAVTKAFSTHPLTSDRIRRMQQEIARILPVRPAYIVSSSDFDEMHARLFANQMVHLKRKPDTTHPTLQHREDSETEERDTTADDSIVVPQ